MDEKVNYKNEKNSSFWTKANTKTKAISDLGKVGSILNIIFGCSVILVWISLFALSIVYSMLWWWFLVIPFFIGAVLAVKFNWFYLKTGNFKVTSAILGLLFCGDLFGVIGCVLILVSNDKPINNAEISKENKKD